VKKKLILIAKLRQMEEETLLKEGKYKSVGG